MAQPLRIISPLEYVRLFGRNRDVRLLWTSGMISRSADWFHYVAVHTLILRFMSAEYGTEEAILAAVGFWTTLAFMAQMFPPFLISPLIGTVCDRFPRRAIMVVADFARVLVALGFLLVDRPELLVAMLVLEVILSSFAGFFETAVKSIVPDLVPPEDLLAANGVLQSTWSLTAAMGAALGAVVVTINVELAFVVNAATFLASLILVRMVSIPGHPGGEDEIPGESEGSAPAPGFGKVLPYVFRRPPLMALLSVKPGWAVAGGMILILHTVLGGRVYDTHIAGWLQGDSVGIGALHAARGIGGLIGTLAAPLFFIFFVRRMFAMTAVVFLVYGISYGVMSQVHHILTAASLLIIGTTFSAQLWIGPMVILQQVLPSRLRGRIFALDHGLALVTMGLSGVAASVMLSFEFDPRFVALVSAGGLLLCSGLFFVAAVFLRTDIESLEEMCRTQGPRRPLPAEVPEMEDYPPGFVIGDSRPGGENGQGHRPKEAKKSDHAEVGR